MILYLLSIVQSVAAVATTVSSPRPPLPLNPIRPNTINYPASHKDLRALKGWLKRFKSIDVSNRNAAPLHTHPTPGSPPRAYQCVGVCVCVFINMNNVEHLSPNRRAPLADL